MFYLGPKASKVKILEKILLLSCNLLGRKPISQTKQITTSTDAQGKDEHDELTTTVWRFTELVAELGLQWRSMKIDVSRFELKGDKEEIETYLAKLT